MWSIRFRDHVFCEILRRRSDSYFRTERLRGSGSAMRSPGRDDDSTTMSERKT